MLPGALSARAALRYAPDVPPPEKSLPAPFAADPGAVLRRWADEVLRHTVSDPENPLYRLEARLPPRPNARGGGRTSWSRRAVTGAALAAGLLAAYFIRDVPERAAEFARHAIVHGLGALLIVSYFFAARAAAGALGLARAKGRLEPILLTRLTDGEIARGLLVPRLASGVPLVALAVAVGGVAPFAVPDLDPVKRLLFAFGGLGVAVNVFALPWIALGFLASRAGRAALPPALIGIALLDPFLMAWGSQMAETGAAWRPLVFTFACLEALYCGIKIAWAQSVAADLAGSLRASLAE